MFLRVTISVHLKTKTRNNQIMKKPRFIPLQLLFLFSLF